MVNPWNPFDQAIASSNAIKKASEAVGPVKKPLEAANSIYDPTSDQTWLEYRNSQSQAVADNIANNVEQANNINRSLSRSNLKSLSKDTNPSEDEMLESIASVSEHDRPGWMAIPEVVEAISNDVAKYNASVRRDTSGVMDGKDQKWNSPDLYFPDENSDKYKNDQELYNQLFGNNIIKNDVEDTYRADPYSITADELLNGPIPQGNQTTKEDILRHYGMNDETLGPVYTGMSNVNDNYESIIDDGSLREANLKSLYMTGKRLKEYAAAGIPTDRTEEELNQINDNDIINKLDEARDHGFPLYTPNGASDIALLNAQNALGQVGDFFNDNLGNIRTNIFKYENEINGKKFTGNDFDDAADDYFKNIQNQMTDPNVYRSYDPSEDHTGMTSYKNVYTATLSDGTTISDDDYLFIDEEGNLLDLDENGIPTIYEGDPVIIYFPNAEEVVRFDDIYDYADNMSQEYTLANDEDNSVMWVNYDPMVLPDGTELTFDEAREVSEGGGNRDYGLFNIAKPAYLSDGLLTEEGGFNVEDIVPNVVDLFAQSAPYFMPQTSIPLAASNFAKTIQGIDPQTMKANGSYSALADNITKDQLVTSAFGSAAMPLTEIGLGRIGGSLFTKPLENLGSKVASKIGERAWMPGVNWGIGTIGEGLEEIPGNIFEELSSRGAADWYANPLYRTDSDGNVLLDDKGNPLVLYDESGHEIRDKDTDWIDRLNNFAEDIPEAFLGGNILGGVMGLHEIPIVATNSRDIYKQNKADMASGIGIYKPVSAQDIYRPITEEELLRRKNING